MLARCLQLLALSGTVVRVIVDGLKEQAKRVGSMGEPTKLVGSIGEFIREQRVQAQVSVRQLAALAGVSNPYLSQIERGLRKPSAEILQQIAKGLQISAEQLYVQAGILEARDGSPETITAILADASLGERQKHMLIEIYRSFCRENVRTAPDGAPDIAPDIEVG
jgi:transcriptional regulator with XRE-family HTH domain